MNLNQKKKKKEFNNFADEADKTLLHHFSFKTSQMQFLDWKELSELIRMQSTLR